MVKSDKQSALKELRKIQGWESQLPKPFGTWAFNLSKICGIEARSSYTDSCAITRAVKWIGVCWKTKSDWYAL